MFQYGARQALNYLEEKVAEKVITGKTSSLYVEGMFSAANSFSFIGKCIGLGYGLKYALDDKPRYIPLYLVGGLFVGNFAGMVVSPFYPLILVGGSYTFIKKAMKEEI